MKKNYEKPTVEVVKFQYRDQVVVASSGGTAKCEHHWLNETSGYCDSKYDHTVGPHPYL